MFCPQCGVELAASAGRCPSCQATVPARSSKPAAAATMTPLPLTDAPTVMGNIPAEGDEEETKMGIPSGDAETVMQTGSPRDIRDADLTIGSCASTGDDETIGAGFPPRRTQATEKLVAPGEPFGTRYHIIRVLGSGGMGVVYQAWDAELGVTVALKVIRPEVTSDPYMARDVERRFKRELLLAREVTHNNVVRIHDLGEINGIKYITMSYVDGRDLATILASEPRLTVSRALRIARGVVSGLRAAHEAGVVHRDLKPANIMIDAHSEARIMDFGIARSTSHATVDETGDPDPTGRLAEFRRQAAVLSNNTMEGAIVGTVEYMAPEQAKGKPVDQRADIYALGLIFYDMLGGRGRISQSESAINELTARMQQAPAPIRTINEEVPESLAKVIARCLEPDPDARYATTKDLEADLQRLDNEGNLLPVLRRVTSRQLAAAALLVLSLLGGTWWLARGPAPEVVPEPMSVLIADFDNQTGDPVFQGSLEQALSIGIEGASFITAYSRPDAQAVATRLQPGSRLDESMARLVSAREGIKIILAGTIARDGSDYRITVRALDPALDPAQAKPLAIASAKASTKTNVLEAVGSLASELRGALGDTTPESAKLAAAETVTAASLEAMRAYARGQDLHAAGQYQEALEALQQAASLDPEFGRAYATMGAIYGNLKRPQQAEENYQKALKRIDRMTEREKYRTLGAYYLLVSRSYDKAIENYEELVRLYPADNAGHANLAFAYLLVRNVDKAVVEGRKAIEIDPKNVQQRTNYAMYAMYAGDFKTSINEANIVLKERPTFEFALITLARSSVAAGDLEEGRKAYERLAASGELGAAMARLGLADLEMYLGRYKEAANLLEAGLKTSAKPLDAPEAAPLYLALAEASAALGRRADAIRAAAKAVELSRHESVLFPAALVLIGAGQPEKAQQVAETLDSMLQAQTSSFARLITGEIARSRKRLGEAGENFREGQKRYDSWFAHFLLGQAYLEAKYFPEALSEFEICVKRKGEATDVFFLDSSTMRYFPPAYYWLGRAQEGVGAADAARKSFEQFLALRSGADTADPLAADARERVGQPRAK